MIDALAALKRALRNTERSSIGSSTRRSQRPNSARIAAPPPNAPRITASVQPRSGASIRPQTTAVSPATDSAAPTQSSRGFDGSRDSGTSTNAPTRHAAIAGRLKRKIQRQSTCSISQPPVTGPIATPSPATAAQMAIARGRSDAGKMLVRMESVVGMIPAAPTPISARDAISAEELSASAARTEPTPKTTRPVTSARRRPKRSPSVPAASRSPA